MKKLTKYLSLLVAAVLLVQMLPLQAAAAEELSFALNADGSSYTVSACDTAAQTVSIPDSYGEKPVTAISSYAFAGCTGLTQITIPLSVTYIGGGAFSDCTALTNVYYTGTQSRWDEIVVDGGNEALLGAALHCASGYAFAYAIQNGQVTVTGGNTAISGELVIPDRIEGCPVTAIGSYAFFGCSGLTGVTLPESITTISGGAFDGCDAIENVYYAGSQSQWEQITIDGGNEALLSAALHCREDHPLSYQVVNGSVKVTGCRTSVIGELQIPAVIEGYPVTVIGEKAFFGCTGLTGITVPAGVTDISVRAFDGCHNLAQIRVDAGNLTYSADEVGVLYNKVKTELILAPKGIQGSFMIPGSVTEIAHRAFAGCTGLNGITIPKNVKNIGSNAFSGCDAMERVYYTGSQSQWNAIAIHSGNDALLSAALHCEDDNPLIYEIQNGFVKITGCDRFVTGELEIPVAIEGYPVTAIGDFAFAYCAGLTGVIIPEGVTTVGGWAFEGCTGLRTASIPGSITAMGEGIFSGCGTLRKVTMGEGITKIFTGMFADCEGLTQITIPDSVTVIEKYAFANCTGLTEITIPYGVTDMDITAFHGCDKLVGIWIDEANPAYSGDAQGIVYNKSKTQLLLAPKGIRGSVTVPEGVREISQYAFGDCAGLTQITIPKSITKIGYSAFLDCVGLKAVYYGGSRQKWNAISVETENSRLLNATLRCENPFDYEVKNGRATITGCDTSLTGVLQIPAAIDGYPVTGIGESAFDGCEDLTGIHIPASVTNIHSRAFAGCTGLQAFVVHTANASYCADARGVLYNKNQTQLLRVPQGMGSDVLIPDGITHIGSFAFAGCTGVLEISIPESVLYILDSAFLGCTGLQNVYYAGTEQQFSGIVLEDHNDALLAATLHSKVEYPFGYWIDDGKVTIGYCDVSASGVLTIPKFIEGYPVVAIDDGAFAGCTELTEVILPNSLQSIGLYAFDGCEGLTRLTVPGSLQSIGEGAFALCTSLEEVVIEEGVQTIGMYAFESGYSLKTVTIPETVTAIEEGAFYDCSALEEVHYAGTRQQWNKISVDIENEYLLAAELNCNPFARLEDGTLQLCEDAALQELTVNAGQTLDLNGHILTVDSLASFGQIVDIKGGGGLIAENVEITSNNWLPIRDNTGCYRFYAYQLSNLGTRPGTETVSFGFTLDFADESVYSALLQSEDVVIAVSLSWGGETKTFAFSKELVARYVALLNRYPTLRPYLRLNVTGLDSLDPGTRLTVTPTLTAVGGKLQNIGTGMTYTA